MGIKTVPHPPYSPDLAPRDFWLFPKLRGCCYETIEEIKEAVMKVIDTLTQEDFDGAFQKLLEWMVQVHCSWRRLLWRGLECHVCTIIKVPIQKSLETYLMILVYIYVVLLINTRLKHWSKKIIFFYTKDDRIGLFHVLFMQSKWILLDIINFKTLQDSNTVTKNTNILHSKIDILVEFCK